jgi:hypothetical protein
VLTSELPRTLQVYPLKDEQPPTWRMSPTGIGFRLTQPDVDALHPDLKYLEQFLPPEKRDPTSMEFARAYGDAHRDLVAANRYYRATVGVWITQCMTLFYFVLSSLLSAWAIDYLIRSGRRVVARIFCYAELYLSIVSWVIAATFFSILLYAAIKFEFPDNQSPLGAGAWILGGTTLLVLIAYAGVLRRWHPALRIGGYVICIGLVALRFAITN